MRRTKVALGRGVERLAARVDQLPAWAFVGSVVLLFGAARAGRMFALLHANPGGMELFSILTLGVFLGAVIAAVRRRQARAWKAALHVMLGLVMGNAFALALIWPFIPAGYALSLLPMLRATLVSGLAIAFASLPAAILLLWLSRRFGSHSRVTERRVREVEANARRQRQGSTAAPDAGSEARPAVQGAGAPPPAADG